MTRFFFAVFLLFATSACAQEETNPYLLWHETDEDVTHALLFETKNRDAWLEELRTKKDSGTLTLRESIQLFQLAVRSEDEPMALGALEPLAAETQADAHLEQAMRFTGSTVENPALTRKIAERFPVFFMPLTQNCFFAESERDPTVRTAWFQERADAWETALEAHPEKKAERTFRETYRFRAQNAWWQLLQQAHVQAGTQDRLLDPLKAEAQKTTNSPEKRTDALMKFLQMEVLCPRQDLAWVADCAPPLALDLVMVSDQLRLLKEFPTAHAFLLRALETPLTPPEIAAICRESSAFLSEETAQHQWEIHLHGALAECCLEMDAPKEAQKWMLRQKELCETYGLPMNLRLAGMVQTASGQRVVQNQILAAEPGPERETEEEAPSESAADYWLKRADYFQGRGAEGEAELEKALQKGLTFRENEFTRRQFLTRLAELWYSQGKCAEVRELFLAELRAEPKMEETRRAAVIFLGRADRKGILNPDAPELWKWLAETEDWSFTGERLLWRIFQTVQEETQRQRSERLNQLYERAGQQAKTPERAAVLGWVLNRMEEPERSIPFLEQGRTSANEQLAVGAAFTLMESFIDLHDWAKAEAIFPDACAQLTTKEMPSWLERIGDGADADGASKVAENCRRKLKNLGWKP